MASDCTEKMQQNKCCLCTIVTLLAIVFITVMIAISLEKLETYEVGLKYHTISKDLEQQSVSKGLHLGEPGFEFIIFPSIFKTIDWRDFRCVNVDGVDINLDLGFQYKVRPTSLSKVVLEFKDYDGYVVMVRNMADSVIHEACSFFNTSEFQSNRTGFQESLRKRMKDKLEFVYTDMTDLQVNNIDRPKEFETAIRSKERAKESIVVAENERPKLLTEAKTLMLEAETQADIRVAKAEADAQVIMTKAEAEASAILFAFEKEAEAYNLIQTSLGLSVEGFLSYLGARTLAAAKKPFINMESPAKTDYKSIKD